MKNSALGLIETYGLVGAVEAADAALKAANVSLVDLVKVRAGIMTLTLEGGVSEVKASVDAGAASAKRLGTLITSHVIPRLDEEVWSIIVPNVEDPIHTPDPPGDKDQKPKEPESSENHEESPLSGGMKEKIDEKKNVLEKKAFPKEEKERKKKETREKESPKIIAVSPEAGDFKPASAEKSLPKQDQFTKDGLQKLKVVELRKIARGLPLIEIPKNQIKYANKATLVSEIIEAQKKESEDT